MTLPLALSQNAVNAAYAIAAILLILGIKRLSSPATARSGNSVAAVGMTIAVVVTLFSPGIDSYWLIAAGIAIGGVIGVASARLVRMTAMPQMVALFNGVGGGAAALIAAAEFHRLAPDPGSVAGDILAGAMFSALIGSVSFSGSLVAFAKLQELLPGRPLAFPGQQAANALLFALTLAAAVVAAVSERQLPLVLLLAGALVFGIALVLPIGGADMPVVISFLNAFTGLAAASAGFVLENTALIIGGTLVGASGTLLTVLMGRAMNRSLANVLFSAFGAPSPAGAAPLATAGSDGRMVREIAPEDAAVMLAYANQVVVVPGYGLAVAQAQHATRELADLLESRGVQVKYAIHPVAGRMPGHMNVLLAEANVPYPQLFDMEDANPEFPRTDVALVIGANDVTNPAARTNPESPLYGMPILDVDQAQNVIVLKRSMSPGFAGIDNELYYNAKTAMLFGDAKTSVERLVAGVKTV
ncbi:MAG: NAD(P)(+) transhydrogenase (Re/Si-specific) subunit beta [Thermoleophilia bacterium]|nr:NAD(P)(+) transhydrogenase (Re/Si-specific) subunit beta [Thermoleophilia bacterium]MDQ3858735.1 NAD(P)(+) transhydrogenase (Re/Si-specific) subunit beta [Actinomycetota bacterium]